MSIVDQKRNRIVCLSQDPKTIFSYGLQVKELISGLKKYQFHIISSQYLFGTPYSTTKINNEPINEYVTWAHEGEERRCTATLKSVIEHVNPLCVFSMGDIHHHSKIPLGKNLQVPWVSWFPWDNHDIPAMMRARNVIEQPDLKITMSKFSYDLMQSINIDVDGMIYNIVDTNTFKPILKKQEEKERIYKLNPALRGKKILLFVGRPNWRKNIEFIVGAFKEITRVRKDVLLYLHVDFNDEGVVNKPNIQKLIHASGLDDVVIFTEENRWTRGIDAAFLNRLYNMVDLYITTHGGEGFGLPICEAMGCGTPFVATDCTSMPEFADGGKRGLLAKVDKQRIEKGINRPWVDIKDFVDKILYLLENDDVRKKMGKRGIYWVRSNCSRPKITQQWEKLFSKLDVPVCDVESRATNIEWNDNYIIKNKKK